MSVLLPKISLFALGGTIASVPAESGQDAVPRLEASSLVEAVPQLTGVAEIEARTFSQRASGDLTFSVIHQLADAIKESFANGVDGVVVTQGTDTLEETSYLLDLLTGEDNPIVLTGAMRNSGLAGPDGPANVLAAVQVAASPLARGFGPLVLFADQIHLARYVRKTHSAFIDTFKSPNLGPVGWVTEGIVRIPLIPRERTQTVDVPSEGFEAVPEVALLKVGLDEDLKILESVEQLGYSGVVIEALGGGHLPSWAVTRAAEVAEQMPVVFVSRTGSGSTYRSTYGFPGSERDLLAKGLISGGTLDGAKARVLLRLLIASGADRDAIAERFATEAL
ncbi:asparaginase [Leucobacter sp. USHLN153]|uniref:asparaginase n=1 Tax=Leucobacter sp. USHLN153 TaxID=3081268 RepID=UPI00301AB277